jgi:hypothetical protein
LCILKSMILIVFSFTVVQGDSFGTRLWKMRISQRPYITFRTYIYECIPCFMRNVPILQEVPEMSATTVQAELNVTLHVCKRNLQDVLSDRSNFRSNVSSSCIVRGLLTYTFPFNTPHRKKSGGVRSGDLGDDKSFEIIRSPKNF